MSKISKLFKATALILKQPSLLNKVLDDADVNKREVLAKYNLPQGLKTVDISELLPQLDITIEPYAALEGGSTPIDIALLKGLAAKFSDCAYFEIGTWRGESAANVASVANSVSTLNLPDETMNQMGLDKKYISLHRYFSKDLKNVTHLSGNSLRFDFGPHEKKYDLVFIDGDHHYESVKSDTANAFRMLKNENSMIVWHDYGHDPKDIRWDVLRGILDGTPEEKRRYLYRVSNTLCAIYTSKALNASFREPFEVPEKHFSIRVKTVKTP